MEHKTCQLWTVRCWFLAAASKLGSEPGCRLLSLHLYAFVSSFSVGDFSGWYPTLNKEPIHHLDFSTHTGVHVGLIHCAILVQLSDISAHQSAFSWKCFNCDVETVEKCIILHVATKLHFLKIKIFAWTVMTWNKKEIYCGLMTGGQILQRFSATEQYRNKSCCHKIAVTLL